VLLTHYHDDHTGGVPQLVDRIPVGSSITAPISIPSLVARRRRSTPPISRFCPKASPSTWLHTRVKCCRSPA
jgi:glyoxylase-like metal-dependent hydrolase (beta-lactamase superfamily II)